MEKGSGLRKCADSLGLMEKKDKLDLGKRSKRSGPGELQNEGGVVQPGHPPRVIFKGAGG